MPFSPLKSIAKLSALSRNKERKCSLMVLLYMLTFSLPYARIMAHSVASSESPNQSAFAIDLHSFVAERKSSENICYSPASIHTCLALIYLGAADQTAEEIRKVLKLEQEDKEQFATKYGDFLKTIFPKSTSNEDAPQLKTATRLFVNNEIKISQQFNKLARQNFECEAENVDFSQASTAVDEINKWVEKETENKIKNLLQPDAVDNDTSSVLVNAIYFKAKWLYPFSVSATSKRDFHTKRSNKVKVDMMKTKDDFGYAELPDLDAKALEMPYKDSNISMLILLPNQIEGLENLEKKLKGVDLNDLATRLMVHNVNVFLPKFRIEFDIDLKETLEKMGCISMFAENANLSGIFDSAIPQRISDIKHKAFVDCNEAGSEAAAATYIKLYLLSYNMDQKIFYADHPFVFIIRSKDAVYFAGHVSKF